MYHFFKVYLRSPRSSNYGEFPADIIDDFLSDEYVYLLPLQGRDITLEIKAGKSHEDNLRDTIVDSENIEVKAPTFAVNNEHVEYLRSQFVRSADSVSACDILLLDDNADNYLGALVLNLTISFEVLLKGAESTILTLIGSKPDVAIMGDVIKLYSDKQTTEQVGNLPQYDDVVFP